MSGTKFFNVRDVLQTLNAVSLDADAGGFGENDFVKYKPMGPLFTSKRGCDGEVTRNATNENRCMIEIHIMSTSDMNDRLSALISADLIAENGAGAGPYLSKDKNGRTIVAAERAWIVGWPEEFPQGSEAAPVMWTIECAQAKMFFGGR